VDVAEGLVEGEEMRLRIVNDCSLTGLLALVICSHFAIGNSQSAIQRGNLQTLIANAQPGDSIIVSAGSYNGNLFINKRLTLIGVDKPIIRGDGQGSVITIVADSCVVKGFVVEHCGSMLVDEDAGVLIKSSYNIIEGNELRDILFGIYLLRAESNIVANNTIVGGRNVGIGNRGSGIHIWDSRLNRFIGNKVTDVRDGFYIQNANHTWIENNDAFNVRYGLHYMYADSNTFLSNRFYENVAGAAIMYSRGIVMKHNVFAHNRGFASYGILFQDCHGLIADSNVIVDNVVGLFFEAGTDNFFRHNVVAQNDIALHMFQNSTNNTFSENNFVDNLNPLAIVGKRTESHWNANDRGNYWSSYDGYDLDANGIGDIPMKIQNVFQFLEGQNANVRLYLYSPASQALAVAATAFPIININEEADEHPLMRAMDLRAMPAVEMMARLGESSTTRKRESTLAWIAFPMIGIVTIVLAYRQLNRKKRMTNVILNRAFFWRGEESMTAAVQRGMDSSLRSTSFSSPPAIIALLRRAGLQNDRPKGIL
jgi:nitrous oxidase accessory protein